MSGNKTLRTLTDFRARLDATGLARAKIDDEPPFRAEMFSSEQMKRHAMALADSHKLSLGRPSARLLTRLAENEGVLFEARKLLMEAAEANRRVVPAGLPFSKWTMRSGP